jgi:predicted nucleic acid-binding protein
MLYFDTSFIVPLFLPEATSSEIERFFGSRRSEQIAISQWTCVEFSSALALAVRTKRVDAHSAAAAETEFDAVIAETFLVLPTRAKDFELGRDYMRQYSVGLRAGDALHLAIAANHQADAIYTLDHVMHKAGRRLGLPVTTELRRLDPPSTRV